MESAKNEEEKRNSTGHNKCDSLLTEQQDLPFAQKGVDDSCLLSGRVG